ncbi:hypothetical protein [Streptomyces sp. NBC_01022]|uniref:hypothetical protein n=1 Tax=Streptomyces sp. NBC_01022 TaxID=2903723 RepID=UPI002DD94A75|nr:hypothetical protein [Streptomyces sp. NBC_01022]WRZ84824.1 hypothetical protein OG316_33475 [Streptomyces sp. NBC_01022]
MSTATPIQAAPTMSPADVAAHEQASYVRPPRESRVLAEPATPTTCRRDYEAGADVRAAATRQQARARR